MRRLLFSFTLAIFSVYMANAQTFDPELAFRQNLFPSGNAFRSANGAPGGQYWQNKVDYQIAAAFDTASHILSGTAIIHYSNNSPDSLDFLWLALDQNADKKTSIGHSMANPVEKEDAETGFIIESASIQTDDSWQDVHYLINDTRMQIRLPKALAGKGQDLTLKIKYHFRLLEKSGAGRAGMMATKEGTIFEIAYWYPRLCVYDDLRGWNTLPFIGGGEFYCEYGDFDYQITVPSGIIVAGAGALVNGKDILSDKILKNLSKARQSDKTVIIRSVDDVQQLCPTKKTSGTTTWHFQMNNSRDVAFACSKSFIWDAAKINLPDNKTALAQSFYPESSNHNQNGWPRATEYIKASVEIFSRHWLPYPYPEATNVAGPVGGMEFPGITFDWHAPKNDGKGFWSLISHEIGHCWFPMIVGANERRYPFMDEGVNTFIDIYAQEAFNNGEYAPKRDGEYAPGGGNPADEIIPVIKELQNSYTLMDAPDRMAYKFVHPLFYFKTAYGLVLLREVILGHERFDYAFQTYCRRWAFKHPSPVDFFRTIDNASGEDLSWFWRGWFYNNWLLDQSVQSVAYKDNKVENGALITIANNDQFVMPVTVAIKEDNGHTHLLKLPVDIWTQGSEWTFKAPTRSKILSVTLDPELQLPDTNRENNQWTAKNQ